jgi:hypothetical protein
MKVTTTCTDREKAMNKKLLAGLTAAGVLAGGASAAALITGAGAAPARATTTIAAARSTPQVPCTGSALTSLVRKGTITQAQAAAVQQALRTYMRDHSGRMSEHMGGVCHHIGDMDGMWANGPMATVLRQLVNKSTITQAQATAFTTAITHQMTAWHGHGWGMMGGQAGMMGGQAGMMGDGHMWQTAPGSSPS